MFFGDASTSPSWTRCISPTRKSRTRRSKRATCWFAKAETSVVQQSGMEKLRATARELKQSAMHQLFTRGLREELQKETDIGSLPESWSAVPLGQHLVTAQYGLSVRGQEVGGFPILRMNCQLDGQVIFRDL